jgi:DNA-binding IclR family transcriptional regulator
MTTRTLARGLSVLEALAGASETGLGPSAISQALGLDKATVTRLLATLVQTDYVVRDPLTRRYRLTGKILRLAQGVTEGLDLRRVAQPHLEALRARLRETVHLAVMEDVSVVYIQKLEAEHSIQLVSAVGQVMPLHSTALGKAILAALPHREREAKFARIDFVPRTERTIRTLDALREEIERTRARGFAIDDRENEPQGACVAAAVVGPSGEPVGAISVSGPYFRMHDHVDEFGEQVRAAAAFIAWDLGADARAEAPGASGDGREGLRRRQRS